MLRMDRCICTLLDFIKSTPQMGPKFVEPVTDTMEMTYDESPVWRCRLSFCCLWRRPTESIELLARKKITASSSHLSRRGPGAGRDQSFERRRSRSRLVGHAPELRISSRAHGGHGADVRSRRFTKVPSLTIRLGPSHCRGGGFFVEFELFRARSGSRHVRGVRSRRWRLHETAPPRWRQRDVTPPRRHRRDRTRVYGPFVNLSACRDSIRVTRRFAKMESIDPQFRLFITCLPHKDFPLGLLQMSRR